VVEYAALDVGQPHDLPLDDFLYLHRCHQFSIRYLCLHNFRGERGHRKYSAPIHPLPEGRGLLGGDFR
jgi:hypothetical protein